MEAATPRRKNPVLYIRSNHKGLVEARQGVHHPAPVGGVGCSFRRGFSRLGDLQDLQAPDLSTGGEHRQRDGDAAAPHGHAGPQGACPFGDGADQDRSQRH